MRRRRGLPQRLLYYSLLIFICLMGYRVYSSWLEDYKLSHPQIIEAVTTNYSEEQPLDGILLWDEQLIYATQDGILTYPSPRPRITAKGEILAALDGSAVIAPYPAYFYPALDGQEGNWVYPKLWPDFAPLPEFEEAHLIENGTHMRRGEPIGKLVPQPQILRCIAYLDTTPSLERALSNKDNPVIRIRTEYEGKERKADVVAVKSSGQKLKVYLRLPFFPPSVLRSRKFTASVITDVQKGVMVPDTAVITKEGKNQVYVLEGNSPVAKEVEGFPADEKNFFIEKGVRHGEKLILDAEVIKNENERLW
ncbi:MAG: hypothetical protein IJQ74_03530 [Synergistaceae bacterium]|nr:hypothetical protein [Synergistaceae bacterium]MBQ6919377.1 hypothetical protein [Synergistaceae bacterium]MBQ6969049.1 hypothetical protein [Synergistaceae bacterium]